MPRAAITLGGLVTNQDVIRARNDRHRKLFMVAALMSDPLFMWLLNSKAIRTLADRYEVVVELTTPTGGAFIDATSNLPYISGSEKRMGAIGHAYGAVGMAQNDFTNWREENNPFILFSQMDELEGRLAWALASLFADSFWTGPGGIWPLGITSFIEAAAPGSQTGTVMEFDKASHAFMRNQYIAQANPSGTIPVGYVYPELLNNLQTLYRRVANGATRPNVGITTEDVFFLLRALINEAAGTDALMISANEIAYGRDAIVWDGVRTTWSSRCPADSFYALTIANDSLNKTDKIKAFGMEADHVLDYEFEQHVPQSQFEPDPGMRLMLDPNIINRRLDVRLGGNNFGSATFRVGSNQLMPGMVRHHGLLRSTRAGDLSARA